MKLKTLSYSVIISFFLLSCSTSNEQNWEGFRFSGKTQGTTYSIIIADTFLNVAQSDVDSILTSFDSLFSIYLPASQISKINNSTSEHRFLDKNNQFKTCYLLAQEVFTQSNGLFSPSIYPLVKEWGFHDKNENFPSNKTIDSLLNFSNFYQNVHHSIQFIGDSIIFQKKDPRFKIDFNGIAQGYSTDVIAKFLEIKGQQNFYVEIGGEIHIKGLNPQKEKWKIGIETPILNDIPNKNPIEKSISVTNCGVATSGNYRNYFEYKGKKIGHILNPQTGKPIHSDIVSVTVVAPNAALADAYATVFILMGYQKTIKFLVNNPTFKVFVYYLDEKEEMKVFQNIEL